MSTSPPQSSTPHRFRSGDERGAGHHRSFTADVGDTERDVLVVGVEDLVEEPGRCPLGTDDVQGVRAVRPAFDPARQQEVGHGADVVAVHVGHQQCVEGSGPDAGFGQPEDRAPSGVDLQGRRRRTAPGSPDRPDREPHAVPRYR